MMSSKRAGAWAAWQLWEMYKNFVVNGEFKSYDYSRSKLSRSTYNYRLGRLKNLGLIRRRDKKRNSSFVITSKGKKFIKNQPVKMIREDGLQSLVIFDVPETKHRSRDTLRRALNKSGFNRIRESCFISRYKIPPELIDLIIELKLENCVTLFSGKQSPLKK